MRTSLAIALAVGVGLPLLTQAADQVKGAQKLIEFKQINKTAEAEALQPGDQIAMVCAKCKTVLVQTVTTEKGHIKTVTPGEKHLCSGCNTFIAVVGVGKQAKDEIKHVCGACGDASAFCCATKPGGAPTEGMKDK